MIDRMKHGLGLVAVCGGMLALSGCDQIGSPLDALSGQAKAPDEFQVVARKPLRMPTGVNLQNLPEPRLGERSPLEPDPNADAVRALLGSDGSGANVATSSSEAALISAARKKTDGTPVTQADIDRLEAELPEELPTLTELLSGETNQVVRDPLNADAEAKRLQSEGIAPAPVNPAQAPAEE